VKGVIYGAHITSFEGETICHIYLTPISCHCINESQILFWFPKV